MVLTASAWFMWQVPGKNLSVRLSLNVVGELGAVVTQGFKSIPKRGLEVGGLLLGHSETRDGATAVTVQGFEPFHSEHRHGPSYVLSDADQERLREAIAVPKGQDGEIKVVGFYRSQTRPELRMSAEDDSIMTRFFSDPAQVFLLIKPSLNEPVSAGFFIWENGTIHGESSYFQFPFRNCELRSGGFTVVEQPAVEQPAVEQLVAEVPVLPNKPRLRHLDSRRIIEGIAQELPNAQAQPGAPATAAALEPPTKRVWIAAAVGLILTGALLFQRLPRTKTPSGAPSPALAMSVTPEGNWLRLTWNRKAPAIGAGSRGVLRITDGGSQPVWNLDTAQLTEGTIVYWPATNDVNFRLEVVQNGTTVSESIRSLGIPPSRATSAPLAPALEPPMQAMAVKGREATRRRRGKAIRQGGKRKAQVKVKPPTTLNSHARIPEPVLKPVVVREPDPLPANPSPPASPLKAVEKPVDAAPTLAADSTRDSRFDRVIGKIPLIRRLRKAPGSVPAGTSTK